MFALTWIFVAKAWGPTVLVKTKVKEVLRTSAFSELLVTNSPFLWDNVFLLFQLVVYIPEEPYLVVF